uniref:AMP_N domain-containing protein n=1 Tax=Haemonchus contortus TaxID=6289 RepID=A0A7I4XTS5_HAECO
MIVRSLPLHHIRPLPEDTKESRVLSQIELQYEMQKMSNTCKLRLRATADGLSVVPDEGHSQHLTLIRTREDFQVHTLPTGFFYRVQSREVVDAYMYDAKTDILFEKPAGFTHFEIT